MDKFERTLVEALPRLRGFAKKLTRDADAAADLVQDVCVLCVSKRHLFREGTDQVSWMSVVMYHKFASNCLYEKRRRTQVLNQDEMASSKSDPSSSQLFLELKRGLVRLTPEIRSLVIEASKGASYQEMADAQDTIIGTVRSRLSRGRKLLREYCDRPQVSL
jgi:RNA polymerase sigma-70 factor (ECF subfamily)